jgi:hypothetical protein
LADFRGWLGTQVGRIKAVIAMRSSVNKSNEDNGEKVVQGGIDLGQGNYLKVMATDAAGIPSFDPRQLMQFQKDLRGIVPIPVGGPQQVSLEALI